MGWNASFTVWTETEYDKWKRGVHCPIQDPNRARRNKAKNISEHPEHFRPTTHPKDHRVPGRLTEEELEETLEEKYKCL